VSRYSLIAGIISQQGSGAEPVLPINDWMVLTTPTGVAQSVATSGWSFTLSQPATATHGRVHSSSASSTNRGMAVWRVNDTTVLGGAGTSIGEWNTAAEGWQEIQLDDPITLAAGVLYLVVTWRWNTTTHRVSWVDVGVDSFDTISEVTFVEGLRSATQNNGAMPETSTDIVFGVDLFLT
jgi:hypothetical protein